jgi:ABC-type multidrug transport system fused ATPase/permease subunit
MLVMGLSGMATILVPSLAVSALASPIVPFVAVPVLVALMGGGIKGALSQQVKTAQQQLRMRLAEQLQRVRRHFFDVHLTSGKFSRADEYFKTLDSAVNKHVQELVQRKSREAQAEISRLKEAMQLDERERAAQTKRTQEQLAQWDEVGRTVAAAAAQIRALQEPGVRVAT